MGVVFYKDKKHFNPKRKNFLENSWTISPHPISSKHPQREGGLYGRGYRGDPPYKGVFIYFYMVPPLCNLINQYVIYESIILQIYELYFTMSNYGVIKKGITFVEPTNESRSVIPFYFRKKYVPFRLGT